MRAGRRWVVSALWVFSLSGWVAGCDQPGAVRAVSESMEPTLPIGSLHVVRPLSSKGVQRGEVVVYRKTGASEAGDDLFTFRAVGLPGDTLELSGRTLTINGRVQREPYAHYTVPETFDEQKALEFSSFGELVVPPSAIFVLGDNRLNAIDSRYHGPVPLDLVVGTIEP